MLQWVRGARSQRDRDRDISEKVALGVMASTGAGNRQEKEVANMIKRLFNQRERNGNSGFAADESIQRVRQRPFHSSAHTFNSISAKEECGDADMYGGAVE
ncbi:hypothetical protein NC653_015174 [Populus alba x Populus x berolinensis]|uniref:Uncharacterized protein n=1 Tax=Populus alba x Populus x berolinensis TaxID=444605 RepID=A0AAD6QK18_9ROSI|nr:hypothetical protein NC653_015174 [Populus alba x Populus x berolinensis]